MRVKSAVVSIATMEGLLGTSVAAVARPLLFYRSSDGLAPTGAVDNVGGFANLRNVGPFTRGLSSHIQARG